ncbi:MAG: diguanylate cyclase [Bacillota bacterium]|nr:diguanylate cyclase [Bacillota bacterium]
MIVKYKFKEWGISYMIPFTLTLIILIGGAFLFIFIRDYNNHEKLIKANAKEIANGVIAVRSVFASNQDRINKDSSGNYEFKHLNPAAAANQYNKIINELSFVKIKQTSNLYRVSENSPDEWEIKASNLFETNSDLEFIDEKIKEPTPIYRYAVPLYIEKECLECHGGPKGEIDITGNPKEGYKVGELRGIISITIPLDNFYVKLFEQLLLFIGITLVIVFCTWIAVLKIVKTLQKTANTDRLTQVDNRNALYTNLDQEIFWASKRRVPLSIIMIDIDYFKKINDNYGHLAGDKILKELTEKVQSLLREGDTLARFGGEEFIILAPNTDKKGAYALSERIRIAVEETSFFYESEQIPVTISIGVVSNSLHIDLNTNKIQQKLLKQVDEALYLAKEKGRNRVEILSFSY